MGLKCKLRILFMSRFKFSYIFFLLIYCSLLVLVGAQYGEWVLNLDFKSKYIVSKDDLFADFFV